MIASLPMYDRPETRAANDRLWALVRDALRDAGQPAPEVLKRSEDPWADWQSPDLLLSQTCGMPFRTRLVGQVTLVGTPVHDLDCPAGHYQSVFVARRDDPMRQSQDLFQARFAYNDPLSQSGWAAAMTTLAELGTAPGELVRTGAHVASARAVAEGRADFASLDAVSWAMIQRWEPFADRLAVVGRTRPTPALPYITAKDRDPEPLATALAQAIAMLPQTDRAALCLIGLTQIAEADYLAVPTPPPPKDQAAHAV